MDKIKSLVALSALSQESRLDAFRLLVQLAPEALPAGEIASRLDVVQNTMSAHLGVLARSGLVSAHRKGRLIEYSVDYATVRAFFAYLLQDCCQGAPEICSPLFDLLECRK
jgi:ArsR family transcriptional regulator, arsenate/arsenite/antimonite-responsive transcriptional repressor